MPETWEGKSKGKPAGYRIFVFILKTGGLRPAYLLLRFVTIYYLFASFRTSKHSFNFYHNRMGYSVVKSGFKVYQNYNLLGQALVDKVVVMAGIKNKLTFELDGINNLHSIAAKKRGGMLLTAHIGNWEAASHLLTDIDSRINIVTFDGEDAGIKDYLESVTGKNTINFIHIKDDMSHIFKINEAFLENELVCMPADRFLEGAKTVSVEFLGEKARFPIGPFLIAAKFKVPVSFVYGMKESAFHYHFFGTEGKNYLDMDAETLSREILNDFVSYMEEKVKRYPGQWYNYYDFWKQ
jgi:predicted LPLAT superfamily acyltransferase